MSTAEHRRKGPLSVRVAILTISTSRTLAEDAGGAWIKAQALDRGHQVVCHRLVPDDPAAIQKGVKEILAEHQPRVLILTGGTGIACQDVTVETVRPLFDKELTAFGSLFAQLSFGQVGSAALLSRAAAGIIGKTGVFLLPGSLKACQLAMEALILPEMGHLAAHLEQG